MALLQKLDKFYFYYFLIHIPITILIDSSFIIPPVATFQSQLVQFHIAQNHDFLAIKPELWMKTFVLIELVFQLPLFIMFVFNYLKNGFFGVRLWLLVFVYGLNASFTTLICIVYVWFNGSDNGLSDSEVYSLIGVYFPTFLIPFAIAIDYYCRIQNVLSTKADDKKD